MQYLTLLLASQKMKTAWVSNPRTTPAAPRQSPYRSQQMKNVFVNLSSMLVRTRVKESTMDQGWNWHET